MANTDVIIKIKVESGQLKSELNSLQTQIKNFDKAANLNNKPSSGFFSRINQDIKQTSESLKGLTDTTDQVIKKSAISFAALGGAVGLATKSFVDYERTLTGVAKTAGLTSDQAKELGKDFRQLSEILPASTNELLRTAQVGAQLGITGTKNLQNFTKTVTELVSAAEGSGLTAEEAATSLARLSNVAKEPIENVGRLANVVAALADNFAASEPEILRNTTEIARGGAAFGLAAKDALAFGVATKSAGIQAELAGSVISRSLVRAEQAFKDGGAEAQNFQAITGRSQEELQKLLKTDPGEFLRVFIGGLGEIAENGGSVVGALESVNLKGDEVNKIFPVLATNTELLAEAQEIANQQYFTGTKLTDEFIKAQQTLDSQLKITSNQITNLSAEFGEALAPTVQELNLLVRDFIGFLRGLDPETKKTIASVVAIGAALAGLTLVLGIFTRSLLAIAPLFRAIFRPALAEIAALGPALTGLSLKAGQAAVSFRALGTAVTGLLKGALLPAFLLIEALPAALSAATGKSLSFFNTLEVAFLGFRKATVLVKQIFQEFTLEVLENVQFVGEGLVELIRIFPGLEDVGVKTFGNLSKVIEGVGKDIENTKAQVRELNAEIQGVGEDPLRGADRAKELDRTIEKEKKLKRDIQTTSGEAGAKTGVQSGSGTGDLPDLIETGKKKGGGGEEDTSRQEIARVKGEIEELLALRRGASEEEVKILNDKNQILADIEAARLIKNDELRELELEKLRLKQEDILNAELEFQEKRDEQNASIREIEDEQRIEFNELEIEQLREFLQSKLDVEKELAGERAKAYADARNKILKDEAKFGKDFASISRFIGSQEVKFASSIAEQLVSLEQSKSSRLRSIGKAAAIAKAVIDTANSAIEAYRSQFVPPEPTSPARGAVAAAIAIAKGAAQISAIRGAQKGGVVPGTGIGDTVPALLEPGEIVIPNTRVEPLRQTFDDFISSRVSGESGGEMRIEIDITQEASRFITARQVEGQTLGFQRRPI